ncbi:MAG: class I SAM-dependent methyltransferase, partial [Sphingomonas sp.]
MSGAAWRAVDAYIVDHLLSADAALDAALATNAAAGLPQIDVSPAQGKMLHLFARMVGARRILEIGTLGGYSTIWLARALPEGGQVVTLEIEPHHAAVARDNIARAGLGDRVEIRVGAALSSLEAMIAQGEELFDLVFVDADKESSVAYVRAAMALARPGTT